MSGAFISFEGGEGSGKSTQLKHLSNALSAAHIPYLQTREPGGTPGSEAIRTLLVQGSEDAWDAQAETLLFYAARLQHVERVIRPAMAAGKLVVCDRFMDSTLVYQGLGKGLSEEYIRTLHHLTLGNFTPDLTIILDIDPKVGLVRAGARKDDETRFENMNLSFHQLVRRGFLTLAEREPMRCAVVSASGSELEVHANIVSVVNERLGLNVKPSTGKI